MTLKDCESKTQTCASAYQKPRTPPVAEVDNTPARPPNDLAMVLKELQSLCSTVTVINTKISTLDGFGAKLDNVERCIAVMNSSVDAVQKSFADLQQDITANANRLAEAEECIGDTKDGLQRVTMEMTNAAKRIAYLESKTEDMENRARRNNLRLVGLPEGAEGTQPMIDYIQHMLPVWLRLGDTKSFTLERAHRTLARPRLNQN